MSISLRRIAILLALTLGVTLTAGQVARAGTDGHAASQFLEDLSARAIKSLTNSEKTESDREQAFRQLLNEAFDIPAIGRFVVGRYWRGATPEQQQAFLEVFEDVIVQRFLPLFAQYKGERLVVGSAEPDRKSDKFTLVDSTFIDAHGREVDTDWRLYATNGGYQIFDVVVEGVSMAITLRSEYDSVIRRAGGLEGLVKQLREKVKNGEFKPAVAAQ